MKANSDKSKQSNKATRRVLAGVLCGASVLSLVLSLVMPPISQAIANDAQTVSTEETVTVDSSSESADVDNTTNGDAERQDNNDVKNDEASGDAGAASLLSDDAGVEDAVQPADDSANDEGDIALAVEDADGYTQINTAQDLYDYLQNDKKTGKFRLNADVECASDITLGAGEVTLDLNGHKIKHNGTESGRNNMPMFNVPAGATLTIEDLNPGVDSECKQDFDKFGNLATLDYDGNGTPNKLTYYVTKSTPNGTATTETLYKHEVSISGAIVGTAAHSTMKLINVCGGTFNLQSGVLTTNQDANVRHLIYADNGSTVSMSGGYVCGASMGSDGAGAGIHVEGSTLDEGSTLEISGGVIAGNYAPSGGGVYARNSTVHMVGGIISGNGTNNSQSGFGAGICAENSNVAITDGHITNNKYQHYDDSHKGNGCHGGGGIAAFNGGSLAIAGGYITGNYSAEAGGGVYAGAWNSALSGFTFSGGTIASNVAQNSEGGGIRISAPTVGVFEVPKGSHAYITNNTTNTTNDWGGGGVFVQGSSEQGIKSASLNIYNALITNNHANGFGGGFAACPTGETAITDTNGIAVFGNTDGKPDGSYNRSGGTHEKTDDKDEVNGGEITGDFIKAGHQDLFLVRDSANAESLPYIAAVTGQMLGGGAANWSGTIDNAPTSIGKYEGAQAKYMIGLKSEPILEDKDAATAAASLFITGNRSNIHGGGIMTNGDVIAGSTTQVSVYPKMKFSGTKALTGRKLKKGEFKFQLLKQNKITKENGEISLTVPSFDKDKDGKLKLELNGCTKVRDDDGVTNDDSGNFVYDLGRLNSAGTNVYYLVEDPGSVEDRVPGVDYDNTIYKIELTTTTENRPVLDINYTYYLVTKVRVTNLKNNEVKTFTPNNGSDVSIKITDGNTDKTFTNAYNPKGSWTPQVTKRVDGGEMQRFKFELYTKDSRGVEHLCDTPQFTDKGTGSEATVKFTDQVIFGPLGVNGEATFTYYIRECPASEGDGTKHEGYTNDTKSFKVVVTATDNGDGTLKCTPVYYEVDANDNVSANSTPNPTFTNTYSTSLPLSGMSGVTLTYLAGAAVLCAAAAWMHIRRKANAKGGERRE